MIILKSDNNRKEAKSERVTTIEKEAKRERVGGINNYYARYRSIIRLL